MNILLPELFDFLIDNIPYVTDIRNLSKVNKKYNKSCKKRIIELEKIYKTNYKGFFFTQYLHTSTFKKYTIEIILDGRYKLLPNNYYKKKNNLMCSMLAFVGNLELLNYAYCKSCPITAEVFYGAIYNGHIDVLDWFEANTLKKHTDLRYREILANLGGGGHIKCFEWLMESEHNIYIDIIVYNATIKGHLHMLKYIEKFNSTISICNHSDDASQYAAQYGHLNILQWFYDNNFPLGENYCLMAADYGQIKILDWALKNNIYVDFTDHEIIIQNGHVDVLQWLLDHNYKINDNICNWAEKYNQNDILNWAIEKGFKKIEF